MRIVVFGAAGGIGSQLVGQAGRRGHEVVAVVRGPVERAGDWCPDRTVIGDGRDPATVRDAIAGADAVIATIAARRRRGPHQTAAVATAITAAMAELGPCRLLFTSAYPIVARRPRLPMAVLRRIFAGAYADAAEMERIVAAGSLDWTVVRLNRLTDDPAGWRLRVTPDLLDEPEAITRADAAGVLLDLVEEEEFVGLAVNATTRG